MIRYFVVLTALVLVLPTVAAQQKDAHEHMAQGDKMNQKESSQTPAVFRSQLGAAVNIYLELKDALVAGNSSIVSEKSVMLNSALGEVDMNLLKGQLHMDWMKQLPGLQEQARLLSEAAEITVQRTAFGALSESLVGIVKKFGPLDKTLYSQHCPMAMDNKGGYWLSDSREIANPYLKAEMIKCGSVEETFTAE